MNKKKQHILVLQNITVEYQVVRVGFGKIAAKKQMYVELVQHQIILIGGRVMQVAMLQFKDAIQTVRNQMITILIVLSV